MYNDKDDIQFGDLQQLLKHIYLGVQIEMDVD